MVMAVADIGSTIIWTTASKSMQKRQKQLTLSKVDAGKTKVTQMRLLYH